MNVVIYVAATDFGRKSANTIWRVRQSGNAGLSVRIRCRGRGMWVGGEVGGWHVLVTGGGVGVNIDGGDGRCGGDIGGGDDGGAVSQEAFSKRSLMKTNTKVIK